MPQTTVFRSTRKIMKFFLYYCGHIIRFTAVKVIATLANHRAFQRANSASCSIHNECCTLLLMRLLMFLTITLALTINVKGKICRISASPVSSQCVQCVQMTSVCLGVYLVPRVLCSPVQYSVNTHQHSYCVHSTFLSLSCPKLALVYSAYQFTGHIRQRAIKRLKLMRKIACLRWKCLVLMNITS